MKQIKRIIKYFFKYTIVPFLFIVILIVLSFSAFLLFFPKDKIVSVFKTKSENLLSREVSIGDIHYNFIGLTLNDIRISNKRELSEKNLLTAKAIRLKLDIRELLKGNIKISGIKIKELHILLTYENNIWNIQSIIDDITRNSSKKKSEDTEISYIEFDDAVITLIDQPDYLKMPIGEYRISSIVNMQKNKPIVFNDFSLAFPGTHGIIESQHMTIYPINKDFSIKGDINLSNCDLLWLYNWKNISFLPFKTVHGLCSNAEITKTGISGIFNGRSLLKNNINVKANGSFHASFHPFDLSINNTDASIEKSKMHLSLFTFANKSYTIKIDAMNLRINEFSNIFDFIPDSIDGNIVGSYNFDGKILNSKIRITDFKIGNEIKLIENVSTDINITNNILSPATFSAIILKHNAVLSVATKNNIMKDININAAFNDFNLNNLKLLNNFKSSNASSKTKYALPIIINGNISSNTCVYDNHVFNKVSINYEISQKGISFPHFNFLYDDAVINGFSTIDRNYRGSNVLIDANITGFKIQRISDFYKDIDGRFFGTGKAKLQMLMNISSDKSIENHIQGRCNFAISNGKVVNTGIQNKLGLFLDPLKFKLKDLEFNTITGNILMDGRNFQIQTIKFISPDIRFIVDGIISNRETVDTRMTLEFNNNFIQDLPNPALITLNKYKKGKWYTVLIRAKGDLSENKFDIDIKE